MSRIPVEIRYDAELERFVPFDSAGRRVAVYGRLCYGDTPAARSGKGDDPEESVKTIDYSVDPPIAATAAVCVGWVTIPD